MLRRSNKAHTPVYRTIINFSSKNLPADLQIIRRDKLGAINFITNLFLGFITNYKFDLEE